MKEFRDFESARDFVRSLGLKSQKEWRLYLKSKQIPDNIPKYPELAVSVVWNKVKTKDDVLIHMPNYKGKRLPSRYYLFNVQICCAFIYLLDTEQCKISLHN